MPPPRSRPEPAAGRRPAARRRLGGDPRQRAPRRSSPPRPWPWPAAGRQPAECRRRRSCSVEAGQRRAPAVYADQGHGRLTNPGAACGASAGRQHTRAGSRPADRAAPDDLGHFMSLAPGEKSEHDSVRRENRHGCWAARNPCGGMRVRSHAGSVGILFQTKRRNDGKRCPVLMAGAEARGTARRLP